MHYYKKLSAAAAVALLMTVPAAQAATVATVDATVSPTDIAVGDTFTIDLATGASTGDFISFETDLSWDDAFVDLIGISFNPSFGLTSPAAGGPFASPVMVSGGSLSDTFSGVEMLATFTFEALAAGSTVVTFDDTGLDGGFLTDPTGGSLFDGPVTASVSIDAVSTDPNVVPLPASLLLLLGGLLGLGVFGRRRL